MTSPIIAVDTDLGLGAPGAEIDDGAALIALFRSNLRVACAATVYGNVPCSDAAHNLARLLTLLGREEIPTGRGADGPLAGDLAWFAPFRRRYGPTPPWPQPAQQPAAAQLLVDAIRAHPGRLTILALGPLTNLALALRLAPDIIPAVRQLICMGASAAAGDAPEFNIRCDPQAADIVLQAPWPLRLIGLDITRRVHFTRQQFAQLPDDDPALRLLKQHAPRWIDTVEAHGWDNGGCALHDAVAVAALLDPTLFQFTPVAVAVESDGHTSVHPVPPDQTHIHIATHVDARRCHRLIWRLLHGESPS